MIQVTNLHKSFGSLKVLDNISFSIDEGEIVSIVGESGCGKTTLLKCICGLLDFDCGKVVSPECFGYVPQNLGLLQWRTVKENIKFPLELLRRKEDIRDIINLMKLNGFENFYIKQLSVGMSQRVAISRALVMRPKVLFLDEPFKSLDEITRNRLTEELRELWRELKTTVLFITHSIRESVHLSDKVVVLSPRPATIRNIIKIQRNLSYMELYKIEINIKNILNGK